MAGTEKKRLRKYIYLILCGVIFLVAFCLAAWQWKASDFAETDRRTDSLSLLEDGWYEEGPEGEREVSLPFSVKEGATVLSRTLTGEGNVPQALYFKNDRQAVRVFLDGSCIYSYGVNSRLWGPALPDTGCYVRLGTLEGTHRLEIRMDSRENRVRTLDNIYIGAESDVFAFILEKNVGVLLFSITMYLFGFSLLGITLLLILHGRQEGAVMFCHAAWFILLVNTWVLTDSLVLRIFAARTEVIFFACFSSFMLFPLPLLSFLESIGGKPFRGNPFGGITILRYAYIFNYLAQMFLLVVFGLNLYSMLYVTHFLMAVSVVCAVWYLVREYRKSHAGYTRWMLNAMFVLFVFVLLGLADYYLKQDHYSVYVRTGIALYSVSLVYSAAKALLLLEEENARNAAYGKLAFLDVMTGCGNRAAFERDMADLEKKRRPGESVWLVMLDMNGLKWINDNLGHGIGDNMLICAASCIEKAYCDLGSVYRIGGDEFAVILHDRNVTEEILCERLEKRMKEMEDTGPAELSLAYGCACCGAQEDSVDMMALYKEADRKMYQKKGESPRRRER